MLNRGEKCNFSIPCRINFCPAQKETEGMESFHPPGDPAANNQAAGEGGKVPLETGWPLKKIRHKMEVRSCVLTMNGFAKARAELETAVMMKCLNQCSDNAGDCSISPC